jgi:alkanesulfonate monooxygenase SsuD/methylene tetrahydromethanopterin reductase-like flavin-dependent oxidoreductase (luciferase family)
VADYGHALEFGVFVTPSSADAEAVVRLAVLADESGLDVVSFQDHPYLSRFLDTWTLLSFVAARTGRVRLAPNVVDLPPRPPAVLARAAASLDILSGGRVELGLGAGNRWDAIEGMGGLRLTPGQSVDALAEAIDVIRALWDVAEPGGASYDGSHYRLSGAERGPAPRHRIAIWLGAYKPRMLRLTGRRADGWLPSLPYLQPGDLRAGNAAIDEAAVGAGRDPGEVRRLLNVAPFPDSNAEAVDLLAGLASEEGVSTFIVVTDDAAAVTRFASEVAPAVREQVEARRSSASGG